MAILFRPEIGASYEYESDVWQCISAIGNFVTFRNDLNKHLDIPKSEFPKKIKSRELQRVSTEGYHFKLTQKEEIKLLRLKTYVEAALEHPSVSPSGDDTVAEVCARLRFEKPEIKPMAPGTLQNYITEIGNHDFRYTSYILSKRPDQNQSSYQQINEELMKQAIESCFTEGFSNTYDYMHKKYCKLFIEMFGVTDSPYCYNTFVTFYKNHISREAKEGRYGSDNLYNQTYVN